MARVEPRHVPRLAPARSAGTCAACSGSCATSIACTAARPPCTSAITSRTGSAGFDCSDNENSIVSVLRRAADPADHMVGGLQLHARAPAAGTPSACPRPVSTAKCSTPTAALYGGSGVGNLGGARRGPIEGARLRPAAAAHGASARRRAARAGRARKPGEGRTAEFAVTSTVIRRMDAVLPGTGMPRHALSGRFSSLTSSSGRRIVPRACLRNTPRAHS